MDIIGPAVDHIAPREIETAGYAIVWPVVLHPAQQGVQVVAATDRRLTVTRSTIERASSTDTMESASDIGSAPRQVDAVWFFAPGAVIDLDSVRTDVAGLLWASDD
jgi:hypothetical protein